MPSSGAPDLALIEDGERVLFARGEEGSPFSSVVTLIRAIHAESPKRALELLRRRIRTTRELGPFAAGMVRVAARRVSVVSPEDLEAIPGARVEMRVERKTLAFTPFSKENAEPAEWLSLASKLIPEPDANRPRHERDRQVGAILVAADGSVIAASANTNARDRTRHAELNVLTHAWLATRRNLPRGTRLYTTLKPCKMCAGLAWEMAEEPGALEVFYSHDDPGPAARDTILERGSNARRRFAPDVDVACLFRISTREPKANA